jgi:hypothetical protein
MAKAPAPTAAQMKRIIKKVEQGMLEDAVRGPAKVQLTEQQLSAARKGFFG